jgi:hypothetical protein
MSGGNNSRPISQETRDRLSNAHKGKSTGPLSDEHRNKISQTLKNKRFKIGVKDSESTMELKSDAARRRPVSKESVDKMRQALLAKGPKPPSRLRPCIVNGTLYDYPSQAAKAENIRPGTLSRVLDGIRSTKAFTATYVNPDNQPKMNAKIPVIYKGVRYASISEASKLTRTSPRKIKRDGTLL